jgi:hypothetical protein
MRWERRSIFLNFPESRARTNTALAVLAGVFLIVGAAHAVAAGSMSASDARRPARARNAFTAGLWLTAIGIVGAFRGFPILGSLLTVGSLLAGYLLSRRLRVGPTRTAPGMGEPPTVSATEGGPATPASQPSGAAPKCRRCGQQFGLGFGEYCLKCFLVANDAGGFCIRCHKVTNTVWPGVSAGTCPSCFEEMKGLFERPRPG